MKPEKRKGKGKRRPAVDDRGKHDSQIAGGKRYSRTAVKLLRRLRQTVQRNSRGGVSCDERLIPVFGPVGDRAIPVLRDALDDPRWEVRYAAAAVLKHLSSEELTTRQAEVLPGLVAAVKDKDAAVRGQAVEALGTYRGQAKEVLGALIKALGDRSAEVSRAAVMAILEVSPSKKATTRTMLKVLETRRSQLARIGALMVLFHLGKAAKDAVPELLPLLQDPSPEIREYANLAIMGVRTPSMRLKILRTSSMRLKAYKNEEESQLSQEELDELTQLAEAAASESEPEPEPEAPRPKGRKKGPGKIPRKRSALAKRRRLGR